MNRCFVGHLRGGRGECLRLWAIRRWRELGYVRATPQSEIADARQNRREAHSSSRCLAKSHAPTAAEFTNVLYRSETMEQGTGSRNPLGKIHRFRAVHTSMATRNSIPVSHAIQPKRQTKHQRPPVHPTCNFKEPNPRSRKPTPSARGFRLAPTECSPSAHKLQPPAHTPHSWGGPQQAPLTAGQA